MTFGGLLVLPPLAPAPTRQVTISPCFIELAFLLCQQSPVTFAPFVVP